MPIVSIREEKSDAASYYYITIAKAIGILLVVAGHFTSARYMPVEYIALKKCIFSFHMPLFMILSGFLFANTVGRAGGDLLLKPFVKKKFVRLMIPYFFISFCIALLNLVLGHFMAVKRTVDWTYLGEIFYKNVGGSAIFLWFIYSLFIIFVIAALFSKLRNGMVWMGILSVVLYFTPLPALFYLSSVQRYLFYFWLGMFLFNLVIKKKVRLSVLEFVAAVLLFGVVYYLYGMSENDGWWRLLTVLGCGITGSYAVICLSRILAEVKGRILNILLLLGTCSAYIYLLHMAGVYVVRVVFEKLEIFILQAYFAALFLAMVAGVFLPILLTRGFICRSKYLTLLMGGK